MSPSASTHDAVAVASAGSQEGLAASAPRAIPIDVKHAAQSAIAVNFFMSTIFDARVSGVPREVGPPFKNRNLSTRALGATVVIRRLHVSPRAALRSLRSLPGTGRGGELWRPAP